jgi:D-glycero-D-manno-heptose 1,7-bisphosphate phosphatase
MTLRAVFIDRDGTILRHVHYLSDPGRVELLPGVAAALRAALARHVKLFLFTNQAGVGRGLFTLEAVEAVNRRMIELLNLGPRPFSDVCIATDLADDPDSYRKPSPRFILETLARTGLAAGEAVMIGDNPTDWIAGLRAGIRSVAIRSHLLDAAADALRTESRIPLYDSLIDWAASEWPA